MTKITEEEKRIIVKMYLHGKTLDKIRGVVRRSKGSVFSTVKAWKIKIGEDNVEEIRRLMIDLNKSNISINECAIGFRITNMLKQFNVIDEFERDYFNFEENNISSVHYIPQTDNSIMRNATDQTNVERHLSLPSNNYNNDLYEFISKIYQGCRNHDIRPDDLVNWAKDLIEFAPKLDDKFGDINNPIREQQSLQDSYKKQYTIPKVLEFSTYIENKKNLINILQKQLKELVTHKQDLENQISKKEEQLNNLSQKEKFALQYLKWYSNLSDTLKDNHNIDIKQVYGNFAKVIDDFNKYDFDPVKIMNDYEKMESLREQHDSYKRNNKIQYKIRNDLDQQVASLEYKVSHLEDTINKINELKEMGFGINEFKQLSNMLLEVATVNEIDFNVAIKKFLKDVKNQYDRKLGFETAINQLNEEKRNIENEIPAYRAFINTKVAATQSMDYLQSNGLTVFDIIGISNLMKAFLSGTFAFHSTKSMVGTNTQSNNLHTWEIFIDSLKKLKDLITEINAKRNELKDLMTQISNKLAEKQQIDNLLRRSTADLNSLALQGIYFMNILNQFSALKQQTNMTCSQILPMVFVNLSSPKDSQPYESPDNYKSKEQSEEEEK